jgi:replicative DNA helicase
MTAVKTKPLVAVTARGGYKKTLVKNIIKESPVDLKRMLPYDNEAEAGVLQACLADPEATDRSNEIINPTDFYRRGYGIIYERLLEFRKQQRSYTPRTVLESFKNHGEYERIETSILELGPFFTGQTSRHFAKIVKDFSVRRSLISAAIKMAEDSFSITPNIKQIESEFINTVRKLKRRCVP